MFSSEPLNDPPAAAAEDAATTAWVNAVVGDGGSVSATERGYVDTLITGLKSEGLFAGTDAIWLLASESAKQAKFDITGNTGSNLALTVGGSPTFTASQGYTCNTADNDFLNLNYTPSSTAVNLTLNSATIGAYMRTSSSTRRWTIGCEDATAAIGFEYFRLAGAQVTSATNNPSGAVNVSGSTGSAGFHCTARTGSTTTDYYFNGSSIGSTAASSVALPTRPVYGLALNSSGTTIGGLAGQETAIIVIGKGWNSSQISSLYTLLQSYMTSLGTQV